MSSAGNVWIYFASWKAMSFLLFWCKSFEKKSEKETFYNVWHKNKDLSRFIQNICENVLIYLFKLFPFSYRNDFITEKYVFFI